MDEQGTGKDKTEQDGDKEMEGTNGGNSMADHVNNVGRKLRGAPRVEVLITERKFTARPERN